MASSVTMQQIQVDSPTPLLAGAFAHLIEQHPIFRRLRWETTDADVKPYKRAQNVASVVAYDPQDDNFPEGVEEAYDDLQAYVRAMGGRIKIPLLGGRKANKTDRVRARVGAAGEEFMATFINGGFSVGTTAMPGVTVTEVGPGWNLSTHGGGGLLHRTYTSGTNVTLKLKCYADALWGEVTASLHTGDPVVIIYGASPGRWLKLTIDSDVFIAPAATGENEVVITTSTKKFDGVLTTCHPNQRFDVATAAGENFGFEHFDYVIRKTRTRGRKVLLVNPDTYDAVLAQYRNLSGVPISEVADMPGELAYRRIPVLAEPALLHTYEFNSVGALTTKIICMDLDEGIRGLCGDLGSEDLDGDTYYGMYVRDTGEDGTTEHMGTRVSWFSSIMHLSTPGLTVLSGLLD